MAEQADSLFYINCVTSILYFMRRSILHLFLALAVTINALAQAAPQRATVTPDRERLRAHVTRLASDEFDGRRTGTPGVNLARTFIANEFMRAGLRPVADRREGRPQIAASNYFQEFPFVASVGLGQNNRMNFAANAPNNATGASEATRAASLDLRLREDWMPLGWSGNARVENAPVTFVGYGLTATDLNYDDYAGADVRGRIALAFAGTPGGDDPHSQFARYAELRFKAIAAREHGARALVVIARETNFADDRLSRLRYDANAGDAGLPVAVVSRQVAQRILNAGGVSLAPDEIEQALRAAQTENSSTGDPRAPATTPSPQPARRRNLSAPLTGVMLTLQTDIARRTEQAANVVGIIEGTDAQLRNEAVIIGAHYDHLGRGGQGSLAEREGEIHHGADDNASGVAALLEIARIFTQNRPRRTLIFIAFGGEEEGLLGSSHYVNHPVVPLAQTVAMINMDMIGRMQNNRLIVGGVGTAREWRQIIEALNVPAQLRVVINRPDRDQSPAPAVVGADGRTVATVERNEMFSLTLNEDGFGPSDHASFYARQIPVLFFFTGTHTDYHRPTDTADRINYEGLERIARFVHDAIRRIDDAPARPTFTQARNETAGRGTMTGFRVYLGTIPNYAETSDGLLLDGVRENSPASQAGLRAGDRIVRLAGRDVRNVYDYTYALGLMRAGEIYDVEIVRGTERVQLRITPAAARR